MPDLAPSRDSDPRLLRLAAEDNICVAARPIQADETILIAGQPVRISHPIPTGHKIAVESIPAGRRIRKYGAPIGSATQDIQPGEYVHVHNLKSDYLPTFDRGQYAGG